MIANNTSKPDGKPADSERSAGCAASSGCVFLGDSERREIAEILSRRANELATFRNDLESHAKEKFNNFPGCVEHAISREITRLRGLRDKVEVPPSPQDNDE